MRSSQFSSKIYDDRVDNDNDNDDDDDDDVFNTAIAISLQFIFIGKLQIHPGVNCISMLLLWCYSLSLSTPPLTLSSSSNVDNLSNFIVVMIVANSHWLAMVDKSKFFFSETPLPPSKYFQSRFPLK